MAKINKNTDLKPLKEYFLGKDTIEFIPLNAFEIPKKGTKLGDLPIHWYRKGYSRTKFNVECNPEGICPICEMLTPKTKWQRIKLWKPWNRFWLKISILIAITVLCLQI